MSDAKIKAMVEGYCAKLPGQLAALECLVAQVGADSTDENTLERAIGETHRLAGTAYCMGYQQIGTLFERLHDELQAMRDGSDWTVQAVGLRLSGSMRAIGREYANLKPESSALITGERFGQPVKAPSDLGTSADAQLLREQRILVADDDAHVRALVRNALILGGANDITMATSGEDALQKLASAQPTILIADWVMAPMDGVELLTQIRMGKTPLAMDAYVIFLTRQRTQENLRKAIAAGVDHFVVKPFTQQSLLGAVRGVLRGRPRAPSSANKIIHEIASVARREVV